jgi:hypothetical protein
MGGYTISISNLGIGVGAHAGPQRVFLTNSSTDSADYIPYKARLKHAIAVG